MATYDFNSSLSPMDFELLCKDLLEADLNVQLENFREGRDKGIDLRHAPAHSSISLNPTASPSLPQPHLRKIIVQCKRYSSFSNLKSDLQNKELPKIAKLNPERYILATSVSLSPQQADELMEILSPFVQSTGDIYGKERLNSILSKYEDIERRHIKLWIGSSGVLDSIINAGTHAVSREEVERTIAAARLYVQNPSFHHALEILKEHHVCIISGIPGIGKTTLARMLLLYFYHDDFDVVKIESDIVEARALGQHLKPRFYYYDDFLGQTAQADKLNKNEDQKLLDFMASVRDSKNSLFVLTTREYILNQARLNYEKLDRADFDHRTCTIDLSTYSRRIRAEILYNHLYFSKLPLGHLKSLVAERGYLQIIDHKNYIPRVIETLTTATWVGDVPSNQYLKLFLEKLDNPTEIWDHAFKNQLSDADRHLLVVLTTLPVEVTLGDLEEAFVYNAQSTGSLRSKSAFKRALKELEGTFLATRRVKDVILIQFQNPSIRDFMKNLLLAGDFLIETIQSLIFFEQAHWMVETLAERKSTTNTTEMKQLMRLLANAMQRLLDARSCSISVDDSAVHPHVTRSAPNQAARLTQFAETVDEVKDDEDSFFIATKIVALAEGLDTGKTWPSFCLAAAEPLKKLGHLSSAGGLNFIGALKTASMKDPSDFDDFETLAGVMEAFPEEFSQFEREEIRESYGIFAEEFASECARGELDIKDPELIREEASRVDYVGDLLNVETSDAQKILREYADKREQEEEEERNWDRDDEHRGGGRSGASDCSDEEIDSMFGTLGK